jgi:ligand-binding sensor domain-containing protein
MMKLKIISLCTIIVLIFLFVSFKGRVNNRVKIEKLTPAKSEVIGSPKFKKSNWANESDQIISALKDSKGRVWFGTSSGGVFCYENQLFKQYTTKDGLSHNEVDAIYEDKKGIIWLGTADGVTTWDGNKFTPISITTLRGANAKPYQPTTVDPLYGFVSQENLISSIIQDSKGHFWFAAHNAVYRYDGKTYTNFTVNDGIKNNIGKPFGWLEGIMEDKQGKIWFGGRGMAGLFCYDGKELTNLQSIPLDSTTSIKFNWLIPRVKDKNGAIWFGNFGGLYRYDGKMFEPFTEKQGLCRDRITNAFKDSAGNLWFGMDIRSNGYGICKYDGQSFQYFSIYTGTTDKIAVPLVEDNEGNLWVGATGAELYRFDGKTFTLFSE